MRYAVILVLATLTASCTSTPPYRERPGADFGRDMRACRGDATAGEIGATVVAVLVSPLLALPWAAYEESKRDQAAIRGCMEGKGWQVADDPRDVAPVLLPASADSPR